MAAIVMGTQGVTEAGLRMLIRASARSSAVYFFIAFAAPGLVRLRRSPITRIGRNAPSFFLAFGFSHLVHLAAIIGRAGLYPDTFFSDFRLTPVLGGALLYGLIGFMCLRLLICPTGSSPPVAAVENVGSHLLWLAFALAFVSRASSSLLHGLLAFLALLAPGLRWIPRILSSD
ncbi:MAG: hypothetical protein D6681_01215 [Calditrichaeota bacterium]|nr:MAG: hypothetical protein D6681_01215 [Calditrichota bacterium]